MRSQWRRLTVAALLSAGCFAVTKYWYDSTDTSKKKNTGEKALAQVGRVSNEVLKKPPTRLLWQSVNTGDNLFNNETIRTSDRGEIRIQFEDGKYIDLEPDSLVVLQQSKGEIALDLMEGSVFVNAKNTGKEGPGLVLNSGNGKVDLRGAASLAKGKGNEVDLQVLEGTATIKDKDGRSKEVSKGASSSLGAAGITEKFNLNIQSPEPQKPYYIDVDAEKPVAFKYEGLNQPLTVVVMAGVSRKELREWASTDKPGAKEIRTKFPLGKYFWKLVVKDPATGQVKGETSVFKTEFLARYIPTMVFPTSNAEIPVERFPASIHFKWQKGDEATKITLEIAKDRNLQNKIIPIKAFLTEDTFELPNLEQGEYYWRMTAWYANQPLAGKVQKFRIIKLAKNEPVQIDWTLPETKLTQTFIDKPTLELSWKPANRQEDIAGFRLTLQDEKSGADSALNFESKVPFYKAVIPSAGRYIASVEAFDKEGNVLGKSEPRTIAAVEVPLLAPPKIIPETGILQSSGDGRSEIKWQPLQGAKEYFLVITNKDGKALASKKYQGTGTMLKNLLPGEYMVKISGVDQFGRQGQEAAPRRLVVPEKSIIKAPKLKRIKVN